MIFGKHINRYYLRYAPMLLLGLITLLAVDYLQLLIPNLYQLVINGMNDGSVLYQGIDTAFTMDFLLEEICFPMISIILAMVAGRFLWRICFFGTAIWVETDLRRKMYDAFDGERTLPQISDAIGCKINTLQVFAQQLVDKSLVDYTTKGNARIINKSPSKIALYYATKELGDT